MFERYTEKARRVVFFARYEASQFGADRIETEHLLLGILRESSNFPSINSIKYIQQRIRAVTPVREKISTSVDLPLSHESSARSRIPPKRRRNSSTRTLAAGTCCWAFCAKKIV